MWELEGRAVTEHVAPDGAALSLSKGMDLIWRLLPLYIAETVNYLAAAKKMPLFKDEIEEEHTYDDDDDGDESDTVPNGEACEEPVVEGSAARASDRSTAPLAYGADAAPTISCLGRRRVLGPLGQG